MTGGERPAIPAHHVSGRQRAAADPALSVWVSASAGTGKTKVLTDRVLRLLLEGARPEGLLCLTFTRAAAAEMAMRVNRQLGAWTTLGDDDALDAELEALCGRSPEPAARDRARRLFAAVLDAPGGLKIMTIHAFCQSLLGRFPLEAGIAPHFEVLDERSAAEMLDAAQQAVLSRARAGHDPHLAEALAEVSRHTDETEFANLMGKLRAARGRLRALIGRKGGLDALIAATGRRLGVDPGDTVEGVIAAACADKAFDRAALAAACGALERGGDADRKRAARIAAWLDAAPRERRARFGDYERAFLKADGLPRAESTLITKPARERDPAALEALLTEQKGLARVAARRKAVVVARASAALLRLGGALLGEYDRYKTARARLDYDDLIVKAGALLGRRDAAPWVMFKLDGGLDHILVDEAQDTSPEQWRVIKAITEEFFTGEGAREAPRTVFVVGDEKQSIFSFQGADVRALEATRAYFEEKARDAGRRWKEVPLDVSFRSTPAVLSAVDTVFANPAARDGVAFADHKIEHRPERTGHAGLVELWPLATAAEPAPTAPWTPPLVRREGVRSSTRLAGHIARTIARWIAAGERLEARDRPIRAGDVMVLVRQRSAFVGELVRALKGLGVAVAGADRMVLSDQLAVMDLVALGRFLLLPEDDLTLATVLKGPLIGLGEEELFELAHGRGGDSVWRVLTRRRKERPAFARAHRELAGLLARADTVPPFELFADIVGGRGGRRKLVARLGPDANDPIDEFLSLALAYGRTEPPSLEGFLHWLEAGKVQIKRDLEQGRDEVRVMTVHGAKGLEAPIVFLPDTASVPTPRGSPLLWFEDGGEDEALLWPARKDNDEACCEAARETMRERRMQEYRRLLFVAMTRAEDRLYVCGWQGHRSMPEECWYRLIEAGLGGIAEPFDFDCTAEGGWAGRGLRLAGRQTRKPAADAAAHAPAPPPRELPGFAGKRPAREPAPPRPLAPSRPGSEEPAVLSPLGGDAGEARFERGRLIHKLLQVLPELAPEARAAACRRLIARSAVAAEARDEIAAEVVAVLDDSRLAAVFGPGSRAEVPLIGVVGGTAVAGQVDRLVVGGDEVMVVDFKTNRAPPAREEDVAGAYLAQMAAYRAVLRQIYPGKSITCALLWSDGPHLMRLSDAILSGWTA